MTFGVSRDRGLFEWSGTSLATVFAQKSNLFNPRMWIMLFDIIRFNQFALNLLSEEDESENYPSASHDIPSKLGKPRHQQSIGEYLQKENYSEAFRDDYLIPMTAAVWSTAPDKASLEFPAVTLVRFMWNHHLLSTVAARPQWMTIPGGSQQYIDAVMASFPKDHLHVGSCVKSLRVSNDGPVVLLLSDGVEQLFDHVILATHADQALEIIRNTASAEEREILSGFGFSTNTAVLHSDISVCTPLYSLHVSNSAVCPLIDWSQLMPIRSAAWSSWNYITTTPSDSDDVLSVCLTYWMNLLQHIPSSRYGHVLVTLNPITQPDPALVQGSWNYHHPLYNAKAIYSQKLLPTIQNRKGISYAGAWTKYGFHEDGFSSGVKVAMEHLGAELPFDFVDSTFSRGRKPRLCWLDYLVRVFVWTIQSIIQVIRGPKSLTGISHSYVDKQHKIQ